MSASFDVHAFASAFAAGAEDAKVHEVYASLAKEIEEATRSLPPFACKKGCNACCFTTPRVTALEWRLLHGYLLTLEESVLARIIDAAEMVRPLVPALVKEQAFSMQCPFLIDGACAVYEARPFVCRAFGMTIKKRASDGHVLFFGSTLAAAHLTQTFGEDAKIHLPLFEPHVDRLETLTKEAGGVSAHLPLWLFTHLDGKRLVPEVDLAPRFEALLESR